MRKQTFFISIMLLTSGLFYSCTKEEENLALDDVGKITIQAETNEAVSNRVLTWLDQQKSASSAGSAEKIKLLINNLDMSGIKSEIFEHSLELSIIPVKTDYNRANNIDSKNPLSLVVFSSSSGEIKQAGLIKFIPEEDDISFVPPDISFTKVFMKNFPGVNGRFELSGINGRLTNTITFKKDRLYSYGTVNKKTNGADNTKIAPPQDCDDYYLLECWYDDEGNVIDYNLTYLYTICNDAPGGGGGGGGYTPYQCNMTEQQAQDYVASITSTIQSNGTSTSGAVSGPNSNGIITRPVMVKRHSIRYNYPGGKSAVYTLFFPGVLYKNNNTDPWKWQSISFGQFALTEGGLPPCLAQDNNAAVSIAISGDQLKATFTSTIIATLKFTCIIGFIIDTMTDNPNGDYLASEF